MSLTINKSTEAQRVEAIKVLDAMLELFAKVRWIKRHYQTYDGGKTGLASAYCLVGALEHCGDGDIATRALKEVVDVGPGKLHHSLESWNDNAAKSKRQVVATIRKAKKVIETGAI